MLCFVIRFWTIRNGLGEEACSKPRAIKRSWRSGMGRGLEAEPDRPGSMGGGRISDPRRLITIIAITLFASCFP